MAGRVEQHPDVVLRLEAGERGSGLDGGLHAPLEVGHLDVEVQHHLLATGLRRPHRALVLRGGVHREVRDAVAGVQGHPVALVLDDPPPQQRGVEPGELARVGRLEDDPPVVTAVASKHGLILRRGSRDAPATRAGEACRARGGRDAGRGLLDRLAPRDLRRARHDPGRHRTPQRCPLVARRRDLPGVHPQLRRRQRRRPRRRRRASAPRCRTWRDSASTRSGSTPGTPHRMADAGYDVADYRDIEPAFGTLDEARGADRRGARPRAAGAARHRPEPHLDEHPWFQAALAAGPGVAGAGRYLFRHGHGAGRRRAAERLARHLRRAGVDAGRGPDGTPGEWYLHLFDPEQPDLDWEQPGGRGRVRGRPAVLVRPRRRRLPDRRRARRWSRRTGLPDLGHDVAAPC